MQKGTKETDTKNRLEAIIEAIKSKKGNKILEIDISKQSSTLCRHFVICDAQSVNQVQSIANEILDQLNSGFGERVNHKEGYQNGVWVLLDYIDIVVHIFQTEAREFYNLEELWGDGVITTHED